jgi:hypothetical protein
LIGSVVFVGATAEDSIGVACTFVVAVVFGKESVPMMLLSLIEGATTIRSATKIINGDVHTA